MSKNNDVARVLVTTGNAACLADGSAIGSLAVGQIGVFDANTNLAIDGSVIPKEFFLAVGLDKDGDAAMDDILQSSGQFIQTKNVSAFTYREHTAAQPMIVKVANYAGKCDEDFAVKLEFRNQEIYRTQGYVQHTKTYSAHTGCCEGCEDCPTGDANEVTQVLLAAFAADPNAMVTALPLARSAMTILTHSVAADYSAGDVILEADLDAMITFNLTAAAGDEVYSDLQLTTVPLAMNTYCNVNLKYFAPRQTIVLPSLVGAGFDCNGVSSTTQEAANEEGSGYDVKQKEYHTSGNQNNQPYVLSTATGTASYIETNAVESIKYDQFYLQYTQEAQAGWLEFISNLSTTIAVPGTDTVTRNSLATILDAVLLGSGFDALADDAATGNVDPAVVAPTSAKTPATDGIA